MVFNNFFLKLAFVLHKARKTFMKTENDFHFFAKEWENEESVWEHFWNDFVLDMKKKMWDKFWNLFFIVFLEKSVWV